MGLPRRLCAPGRPAKDFDNAVRELSLFAEGGSERATSAFVAAKALLLNDRPADGLELLVTSNHPTFLFDLFCARLDYRKALDLPEASVKTPANLDCFKARILYLLGEQEEAEKRLARLGESIKDDVDPHWVATLLQQEYRAGLKDLAFEHCGKALSVRPAEKRGLRD